MTIGINSCYGDGNKNCSLATGVATSVLGMGAYYLPVTKDRFIRTAYNIVKNDAEEQIEQFNDAAVGVMSKNLKKEQKLFLAQNGVAEDVASINSKIADLKKVIIDDDVVKNLKATFADNFKDYKISEALMDNTSSRAFRKIRWTNFAWGAGLCFLLGSVFGANKK